MDLRDIGLADLLAPEQRQPDTQMPIAIIGMAAQVGDAADLAAFWQLLAAGRSAVSTLSETRRAQLADYLRLKGASDSYRPDEFFREAFLPRIDQFDHSFFGLSWQEACLMDPQQRLLLQACYQALEQAGYAGSALDGSATGVFIGASEDFGENYRALIDTLQPDAPEIAIPGNIRSVLAGRLAYLLNLTGPALVVDTACSSALVAVHLACRALQQGDCQQAIVGAVNLNLVPLPMKASTGIGARDIADNLAADGETKAFAAHSDGMSLGEGVFALLLKPLAQAQADGDCIQAVILASAVNQDGHSMGLTAPNGQAQTELLCQAWQQAGIDPAQLSYLEAHGTGTRLGDPIEVSALRQAFERYTQQRQFCGLGSVKTNVGHLDNAAGLAGLCKVVLALQQRMLPPSLNFCSPNPQIVFEQSPVYLQDRLTAWTVEAGQPRLAGVSAFGLSGTNCHLVVQEAPPTPVSVAATAAVALPGLMLLSARSPAALRLLAERFADWFVHQQQDPAHAVSVADLCQTLQHGRPHFCFRLALWGTDFAALSAALNAYLTGGNGAYQQGAFRLVADDSAAVSGLASDGRVQLSRSAQQQLTAASLQLLAGGANHGAGNYGAGDAASDEDRQQPLCQALAIAYVGGANPALWPCSAVAVDTAEPANAQAGRQARRVPLPGYPLAETSCWLTPSAAGEQLARRSLAGTTLVGTTLAGTALADQLLLPLGPGGQLHPLLDEVFVLRSGWLAHKRLSRHDWQLAEHQIDGVPVLPGTCYLEMLLALACLYRRQQNATVAPLGGLQLKSLQFLQPLLLSDEEATRSVWLEFTPTATAATLTIYSRRLLPDSDGPTDGLSQVPGSRQWQIIEHASATLRQLADPLPAAPNSAENTASPLAAADAAAALTALRAALTVPVAFQVQDDLSRGLQISDRWYGSFVAGWTDATAQQYLFEFQLPALYASDLPLYWYHPALLDTAINAANHLIGSGELYLPFCYQDLQLQQPLTGHCYFVLTPLGARRGELVEFSVAVYAGDGSLLATVARYGVKKAQQFSALHNTEPALPSCYQLTLTAEPAAEPLAEPSAQWAVKLSANSALSRVLLLCATDDCADWAAALAKALPASFSAPVDVMIRQADAWLAAPEQEVDLLLYLAVDPLGAAAQASIDHALAAAAAMAALTQLQQVIQQVLSGAAPSHGMLVLTQAASGTDPLQAALASYSQVAVLENPQLPLCNLQILLGAEVEPQPERQQLATALLAALQQRGWPSGNALPGRLIWQPTTELSRAAWPWLAETLTPLTLPAADAQPHWQLRAGGGYLLTGGSGGLGLALAKQLANHAQATGCPIQLLLTGSRATPAQAVQQLIADCQSSNPYVQLWYQQADAADQQAMQSALTSLRASASAGVAGVFHLAGRAGGGFIRHKTAADTQAVLASKVVGSYLLHQLTKDDQLDCFVCYSSVLSWFPEAGQSDYAAANRLMDALCQARRAAGLPALSLCWPAWQDTGMAVDYQAVRHDELLLPQKTTAALAQLWQLLQSMAALPAAVLPGRLNRRFAVHQLPALAPQLTPALTALLAQPPQRAFATQQQPAQVIASSAQPVAVQLSGIAQPDGYDLAVAAVWAQVLGVNTLDADDHFNDLGGNSILVTQQYKAFAEQFPGAIEMTDLFSRATVRQQAELVRQHAELVRQQAEIVRQKSAPGRQQLTTMPAAATPPVTPQAQLSELEQQLARLAAGEISPEQAAALI